jgi:glutaredoxin 3
MEGLKMPKIDIYTRPMCGFCSSAKRLLDSKGVEYNETNIWSVEGARDEMLVRSNGGQTVPQIFIGDVHVGGCDDLFALERAGKLDPMLAS